MSIRVFSHIEPVLSTAYPYSSVEISALEFTVKG